MDCDSVGPLISELYDGEPVFPEAVGHIVKCGSCRERLRDYAALSAEVRLLAAQEREEMRMPTMMREVMPKRNSFLFALRKTMRVPRFVAAACALVIILLAGGWAHTRAQNTPLWFAYELSFHLQDGTSASVGYLMHPCGPGCEVPFTLGESGRLAGIIGVEKIEGGKVYLTLRLKRFATAPDSKHLAKQMADVPASAYLYVPGTTVSVPVAGGGKVEMTGLITTTEQGHMELNHYPSKPARDEMVLLKGVMIRDGQVIADMSDAGTLGGRASGPGAGFYEYVPGHGLFAAGLKPFTGAIPGIADYGQIRFDENGVKYMFLTSSQITGGDQPRTIWVLHLLHYLPSQHDAQAKDNAALFGTGGDIGLLLKQMGAINQE